MKKGKKILAAALSAAMLIGMLPVTSQTVSADADPVITKLPCTTSTEADFDTSFLSVTGFAKGHVSDRTEYIGTDYYRTVSNETEFLEAIDDAKYGEVKVIEITADLDLAWGALDEDAQSASCISEYEQGIHGTDIYNPAILKNGVSKLNIHADGLTIFSKSGNTIEHAEITLQTDARDIVIRNLKFDGMWHYSDSASSKEAGWTLMKIYAKNVWIDHCSFTIAADGCVDSENGAENVTMSWCTFSMPSTEDPDKDSALYESVSYMEYLYRAGKLDESTSRYYKLRANGATMEKILAYEAYHNKCNLNGSGDKDFKDESEELQNGNQHLHLTMAYNYVTNIGQRFPLLRQGTMHLMNCYIDNSGHQALQAIEPFKTYGGWTSNRAINARDGATVGADNCVFNGLHAINGEEMNTEDTANMNEGWNVAFSGAYNHALVVNSKVTYDGETYVGSSWDNNGDNLFIENAKTFWNDKKSTINNFYWYSSIVDDGTLKRGTPPTDDDGNYIPFTFTYTNTYTKDDGTTVEGLPYDYELLALDDVETIVPANSGAYAYSEDASFWLRIDYEDGEGYTAVDDSVVVDATELRLSDASITLDVGAVNQLSAKVVPSNATDKELKWESSDESVAEVMDSGLVIGKGGGTATITVKTADGKLVQTCDVTVTVGVEKISIVAPTKTLYLGDDTTPADSVQLTAVVAPDDATDKSVTWTSSSESVVKVDENGVLTPLKKGNSTITCKSNSNTEVMGTVRITVKEGANPNPTVTPTTEPSEEPTAEPSMEPTTEPTTEPVLYGDADENAAIDARDALVVLRNVVKLTELSDSQTTAADVDGDGSVTASDALLILQKVVKLIDTFPVER